MTGLISIRSMDKMSSYLSIMYKAIKLANHYNIDPIIISLDFIYTNYEKGKFEAKY